MSDDSAIEWTDATWNPVRGCTEISPGCKNCYAKRFAERFRGVVGHAYEQGFDVRTAPSALDKPLHWKKPRKIFVNSMSDLFHVDVPAEYIYDVFSVMEQCPQHTFQVLTKRAERMVDVIGGASGAGLTAPPLPNVWIGVSVENQAMADKRIPLLLQVPAAVRFLSVEPLLGPVDLMRWLAPDGPEADAIPCNDCGFATDCDCEAGPRTIDWVIVGGESGPGARPCDLAWIRSVVEQCTTAAVPVFVKQLGADPIMEPGPVSWPTSDSKGNTMSEWPEDLRVRAFPEVRS